MYIILCVLCEWQHRYMLMYQTFNPKIQVQFFIPLGWMDGWMIYQM